MIDETALSERLHALDVTVPPDLADRAAQRGRRRVRLRVGGGVLGVAVLAGGVGTAGLVGHVGGTPEKVFAAGLAVPIAAAPCQPGRLTVTPRPGVAGADGVDGHARVFHLSAADAHDDAALEAVCLPDPAPGFPVDRGPATGDSGFTIDPSRASNLAFLERSFLLERTPSRVTKGGSGTSPTGPQASVLVSRSSGPDPAAQTRPESFARIGTTTVRGIRAAVVRADRNQLGVLVRIDGFDVQAYAGGYDRAGNPAAYPGGDVQAVRDLTTLIDSLQNLG